MAFSRITNSVLRKINIPELLDSQRKYWMARYRSVTEVMAIDFETTADVKVGIRQYLNRTHPELDKIFAWQTCDKDGNPFTCRIPINETDHRLQRIFNDTSVAKLAHNFKFEFTQATVEGYQIPPETVWHDSMILSQLAYNLRPSHALDNVAYDLCRWDKKLDGDVLRMARLYGGFHKVPVNMMTEYQKSDVQRSMILYQTWWPEVLENERLLDAYINEIQTVIVTQIEEETGLTIDEIGADELVRECERLSTEAAEAANRFAETRNVNLNRAEDTAWLLYKKAGAPALLRTPKGAFTTKQEAIEALVEFLDSDYVDPDDRAVTRIRFVIDLIQKWRAYSRGYSIINGYLKLMDSQKRLHPSLKTNHAKTGREACEDPNLQNVSKKTNPKSPYAVPARKCFCAPKGFCYLLKDQSGIELRLIIEAANSRTMIDAMARGEHPHVIFCKIMFGDRYTTKKECPDLYQAGKNTHFALCYGAAITKIAATAKLTYLDAEAGYNLYAKRYPEIAYLVRDGVARVRKDGYIVTPFGRKLYVPQDTPFVWLNYMIQGMAAEIIKRGQVNSMWYLQKRWGLRTRPVMTIHDEIIYQIPLSIAKDAVALTELSRGLDTCMTYMPQITVPLEAESKITYSTWFKAEDIVL